MNVSFQNLHKAKQIISEALFNLENKEIILEVDGQFLSTTFADLGVRVNKEGTLDLTNNYVFSLKSPLLGGLAVLNPFYAKKLNVLYNIDQTKFNDYLSKLIRDHNIYASDSKIVNSKDGVVVLDEQNGEVIDIGLLVSNIKQRVESVTVTPIHVKKITEEAKVKRAGTEKALGILKKLNSREIVFKHKEESWKLAGADLLNLTELNPSGRKNDHIVSVGLLESPVVILDTSFSEKSPDLAVGLSDVAFDKYFGNISKTVNKPRVDATMKFENGRITNFSPAKDGQKLDIDITKKQLQDIFSKSADGEPSTVINLAVTVDLAQIANDDVSSLGIKELLASGVSFFRGSIPNRVFNVGLGASRVSGTIVGPGDTFSFNNSVGEVSGATGYKQAYVISAGRTVLDDGGGICQVSTTVYRAALNAGLPIISRTAHAYRVAYYEQGGFGPGMDATVWSPSVDLKFQNDSSHHVLVQAIVDPATSKLQVDIYGTRDERRVEISKPVVLNVKSAPPDKFQDDPALPKGTTKQVDFAAPGATSVFTRKVYSGDKLVIDESIKSVYRPWQAIFLVGTG